ncbi:hypothetical protein [Caulobacter sp. S45]|uniref:hypothetical protein n=1 Tax=Caulobacter sp. S45 TaxID=1641861 RepID=UPI0015759191|nr:hypothetical protein [Caulobacter sp. S45]
MPARASMIHTPPAWPRVCAVLAAAVAMMWAALVNGQPFFTPDTQAYVRGPDVAVVKLLGARFASPWARQEPPGAHVASTVLEAGSAPKHSYDDNEVLAGRSIYYGALAYLGQITGGFWLTVFVQGLAVAWLAEIVLRAADQRSLLAYAVAVALLALATPAPFFVADLMPDIWSGVAVGAMALLFALPHRLTRLDLATLAAMTVFAAMAHSSHVLIIAGVLVAGLALWGLGSRLGLAGADPRSALVVGMAALVCAVAGTMLFSAMVKHSVGAAPITPPFLTARVVADGPGRLYVREHCHDHPFAVCAFADRLAGVDTDGFLWDENPKTGVFAVASPAQRQALATEQARFALASTLAHPWLQAQASAKNVALQLVQTDLDDFDYKPNVLASLRADLPPEHRARLETSLAARRGWPIGPLWAEQAVVIWLSLGVIAWSLLGRGGSPELSRFALLAMSGVLANTLACGVLSDLYGRYQARCIWVLPLAATMMAAQAFERRRRSQTFTGRTSSPVIPAEA